MADEDWYEDDYEDAPQGDNLVNRLRKELRAKSKAEKELTAKLAELQGQARSGTVKEFLKAQGVSEKVARLVPGDVEPTPEGLGEWLKEYQDIFGAAPAAQESQSSTEVDPAVVAQMNAMNAVASTGANPVSTSPVGIADLKGAASMEELMALIKKGAGG